MKLSGQCHCGTIRYEVDSEAITHALCHCSDCRRHAGAPMVGWAMFLTPQVTVLSGTPKIYRSSENGRRHFCPDCGTGLFYTNEITLPGITDIQTGTLDTPDALPARTHIQTAESIAWMKHVHELPKVERYPMPT